MVLWMARWQNRIVRKLWVNINLKAKNTQTNFTCRNSVFSNAIFWVNFSKSKLNNPTDKTNLGRSRFTFFNFFTTFVRSKLLIVNSSSTTSHLRLQHFLRPLKLVCLIYTHSFDDPNCWKFFHFLSYNYNSYRLWHPSRHLQNSNFPPLQRFAAFNSICKWCQRQQKW